MLFSHPYTSKKLLDNPNNDTSYVHDIYMCIEVMFCLEGFNPLLNLHGNLGVTLQRNTTQTLESPLVDFLVYDEGHSLLLDI